MALSFSSFASLPFPFREELRLISSLPLNFQKLFWNVCFTILEGARDPGVYQQEGVTQQWEVVFSQTCLPRRLCEREEPARVCKHVGLARGDGSCSSHNICLHCQSLVCPRSTILSSQAPRVDLSLQSFPSVQHRISSLLLACLTACLAPVSLQTSALVGDSSTLRSPWEKMGL